MDKKNIFKRAGILLCLFLAVGCLAGLQSIPVQAAKKVTKIKTIKFTNVSKPLALQAGSTKTIKVSIKPAKANKKKVRWTSSNTSVASVSSKGVVKAKKNGSAVITLKATDGSKKKAQVKVVVTTRVKTLRLTNVTGNIALETGNTFSTQLSVEPSTASDKRVTWGTSDPAVAYVDKNGIITAMGPGSAKITALALDNSGAMASYMVTVTKPPEPVSTVALSFNAETVENEVYYLRRMDVKKAFLRHGFSFAIASQVLPETADNRALIWGSSDNNIAQVDQTGRVTGIADGTAIITAVAADGSGAQDAFEVQVASIARNSAYFVAHRGYNTKAPENSLAAIRLACESGFSGVEIDVRHTSDDQFVVMHDSDLKAMCGVNKSVASLTLAQATSYRLTAGSNIAQYPNEKVPSLAQAMTLMKGYEGVDVYIELKADLTNQQLGHLLTTIDACGMLNRAIIISSRMDDLLKIRMMDYIGGDKAELVLLRSEPDDTIVNTCIEYKFDLGCKYNKISKKQRVKLHNANLKSYLYTLNGFNATYNLVVAQKGDMICLNEKFFD